MLARQTIEIMSKSINQSNAALCNFCRKGAEPMQSRRAHCDRWRHPRVVSWSVSHVGEGGASSRHKLSLLRWLRRSRDLRSRSRYSADGYQNLSPEKRYIASRKSRKQEYDREFYFPRRGHQSIWHGNVQPFHGDVRFNALIMYCWREILRHAWRNIPRVKQTRLNW